MTVALPDVIVFVRAVPWSKDNILLIAQSLSIGDWFFASCKLLIATFVLSGIG